MRFLGRNAELPQALPAGARSGDGMGLNALRAALEERIAERRAELERAELDRRLRRTSST